MSLDELAHLGLVVTGIVSGLAALGLAWKWIADLLRWARRLTRTIDALNELAQYELNHNGGGSLKDHAAEVPKLVDKVAALDGSLTDHLTASSEAKILAHEEQTAMWQAIKAVAKSSPPDELDGPAQTPHGA